MVTDVRVRGYPGPTITSERSVSNRIIGNLSVASIVLLAAIAAACADKNVTNPSGSSTAGLTEVAANNNGAGAPGSGISDGPGYFQGTVVGPSATGSGSDSMTSPTIAPRIAGVVITIYPRIETSGDSTNHGPAAGSTITDANGHFQLPTLPAGDYVETFVPPTGSPYYGAYAFGPLRSNSSDYPWWVVLAKK